MERARGDISGATIYLMYIGVLFTGFTVDDRGSIVVEL
jgi:hypothetical protein